MDWRRHVPVVLSAAVLPAIYVVPDAGVGGPTFYGEVLWRKGVLCKVALSEGGPCLKAEHDSGDNAVLRFPNQFLTASDDAPAQVYGPLKQAKVTV